MVLAAFSFLTTANAQQTLGSINGTVLDPSGAAVSGSSITVTDAEINFTRTVKAQSNGFFQIFNLPVGTYKIQATHDGFDTTEIAGISVKEAGATTLNVTLKVGQTTTSVEVTVNPLLNATDATNGYTLDKEQIALTPLATGSFTQLAVLSPGVNAELLSGVDTNAGLGNQPIWANGQRDTSNTFQVNGVDVTNLFNGKSSSSATSQRYNFNIGAGSTSASSTAGAGTTGGANPTGTSVYGSNGNSLPSPPPEMIQEMRVNTSMYDAQQGATSGAQIDVNTLSGTNAYHGQVYGSLANNYANAAPFFFKQQYLLAQSGVGAFPESLANPQLHRWTSGATLGGALKKDKLFFFLGYQHMYASDESTGVSQFNVPSGLTDDRSVAGLVSAAASAGFSGVNVTSGSIPYALMNAKLSNGQYMIPSTQLPTTTPYAYGVPNVTLVGVSVMAGDQANAALDYDLSKNDRLSFKYYYQNDPVTKPYGLAQTGGFPQTQANGSQVGEIDNTISIGSRLNWEQRLGYARMRSYSYYQQTIQPDPVLGAAFGIGSGDSAYAQGLLPGISIAEIASSKSVGSSPALKLGPDSAFTNTGYFQNRLNPSTNVIFTAGRHTLIAGGGYNYTQLNIRNNRSGMPLISSSSFGNFLNDKVKGSEAIESVTGGRNNADRYYRANELAGYLQDKWQALPNLSITAGVRYDYHGGMTEKYGNMFNFDPNAYDVSGTTESGFTVNNAGFVIAGNNPNATAGTSDSTLTGRQWGVSPRVGFAWSPKKDNNKVVFSGGAGIYYDRGELFSYLSQPAGGAASGPFGVTESAPLVNDVVGTGKTFADPLGCGSGNNCTASSSAAAIQAQLQSVLGSGPNQSGGMTGTSASFGRNCGGRDSQEGYLDCPNTLYFGAYDKGNVLPYTINYTLNMQWQPRNDLAIMIGYTGNRGRHAVIPIPFNEPQIATPTSPAMVLGKNPHPNGEQYSYGFEVLNQNNLEGYDYAPIANEPWNTESGGNTDFRAPYVGYNPNAALFKTVGVSAYDALQTHLEKRLSHNYQVAASYTWSHALDEQSDIGLFFTGDNPNKLRDSWGSSDFDRTHVLSFNFQAQLPNTAHPRSALSYLTNDWVLTGTGVLQSGEPYSLYEFYGAVGSINFGDYPLLMNPVLPIKNPSNVKAAMTGNKGSFRGVGGDYIPAIDPSQIAIDYLEPGQKGIPVSTGSDPQDIYETDFVPGQRNLFRQSWQRRADISFRKTFKVTDRIGVQYAFNVFNVFNTTSLDVPQNQTQIRQNSACSNNATSEGNNCSPGQYYYVNYGQIVTSNLTGDQQSALANLDQKPIINGSGKGITVPTTLPIGTGTCVASGSISAAAGCPNNGANFGSVTGTIGGSRAITMSLHITY